MLIRHVERAPIRVKAELKNMPARSQRETTAKARVGGELAALERCRDAVKEELARTEQEALARSKLLASKSREKKSAKGSKK